MDFLCWWLRPVIIAFKILRQEDCELWTRLGYIYDIVSKKKNQSPYIHPKTELGGTCDLAMGTVTLVMDSR